MSARPTFKNIVFWAFCWAWAPGTLGAQTLATPTSTTTTTKTSTVTLTPTESETPTPSQTFTPNWTQTALPTLSPLATGTPTLTPTPAGSVTAIVTATDTPVPTATGCMGVVSTIYSPSPNPASGGTTVSQDIFIGSNKSGCNVSYTLNSIQIAFTLQNPIGTGNLDTGGIQAVQLWSEGSQVASVPYSESVSFGGIAISEGSIELRYVLAPTASGIVSISIPSATGTSPAGFYYLGTPYSLPGLGNPPAAPLTVLSSVAPTSTPNFTQTVAATLSQIPTATQPVTNALTLTPLATSTPTQTPTQTFTPNWTQTVAATLSQIPTATQPVTNAITLTPVPTATGSPTLTFTQTGTPNWTQTAVATLSQVPTATEPVTNALTLTPTVSVTPTATVCGFFGFYDDFSDNPVSSSTTVIQILWFADICDEETTLTSLAFVLDPTKTTGNLASGGLQEVTLLAGGDAVATMPYTGGVTFTGIKVSPATTELKYTFSPDASGTMAMSVVAVTAADPTASYYMGWGPDNAKWATGKPLTVIPAGTPVTTSTQTTTYTPTSTPTQTFTPLATATSSPTLTPTHTSTQTNTYTPTPTVTATSTPGTSSSAYDDNSGPITLENAGATVIIPAGSLPAPTTIALNEYPASSAPPNPGFQLSFMGTVFQINSGGMEPISSAAVTIILPYSPALIPTGETTADMSMKYFDGSSWTTVPFILDTLHSTLTAVVNHFSWWASVVKAPGGTATPTASPTGTTTLPAWTVTPTPVSNFEAYPNPARDGKIQVYVPGQGGLVNLRCRIITPSFRKIRDVELPNVLQGSSISLNLQDGSGRPLADGLYYLEVTSSDGTHSILKILVLR